MTRPTPVLLCILDGWGENPAPEHNAIAQAHTPVWNRLRADYPFGLLDASEGDVGLPPGQMGNSEVGHMNIGAGRVVMQDLPRIDAAIADGTLARTPALQHFIATLKRNDGTCHLMGLLSDGGVHSHQAHLHALAGIVSKAGIPVALHIFTDGRDVAPKSADGFLAALQQWTDGHTQHHPNAAAVTLATLSGRYYAMDRDKRWERVAPAYHAITQAVGARAGSAAEAIARAYGEGVTDEFIPPTVIGDYAGMRDGDGLLVANFRADRVRQLLTAFTAEGFEGFARPSRPALSALLGMAEYSEALNAHMPALFPAIAMHESLGEVVAAAGLRQLRIAETEKYAHVTFFFNGGREEPFAGEQRIMIPSPKVATYDLKPEMSAAEVTDRLVEAIAAQSFDLIVVNFANTDMVGHSGDLAAAIRAVEAVDQCLGRLYAALQQSGGAMLITADHGNAECLHDADSGQPHTAHTLNPVPCVIVGAAYCTAPKALPRGKLADIAPTLCAMLGLSIPSVMSGRNLLAAAQKG